METLIVVGTERPQDSNWFGTEMAKAGKFATIFHGGDNGNTVTVLMRHNAYTKAVRRGTLPRSEELRAARVCSADEVRHCSPILPGQTDAILLFDDQEEPLVLAFSENTWFCGFMPDYKTAVIKEVRFVTEQGIQSSTRNIL